MIVKWPSIKGCFEPSLTNPDTELWGGISIRFVDSFGLDELSIKLDCYIVQDGEEPGLADLLLGKAWVTVRKGTETERFKFS